MRNVILVTGISGAGKTHYAATLSSFVLSYDAIHCYPTRTTDYNRVREWAQEHVDEPRLVVDAWGFMYDPDLAILQDLVGGADATIAIVYVYTTPLDLHVSQLQKAALGIYELAPTHRRIGHVSMLKREMVTFAEDTLIPLALAGRKVSWVFRRGSALTEHIDARHLLDDMVSLDPLDELLQWVDDTSGDPAYQTIEVEGRVVRPGYMRSEETWQQMVQWGIPWAGKTIGDLGCFNGYFSFRAEQAGATEVVGYDCNEPALTIARRLGLLHSSRCRFVKVDLAEEPLERSFDIILLLNVCHHIADQCPDGGRAFLESVFRSCCELVITVDPRLMPLVEFVAGVVGYRHLHEAESHVVCPEGPRVLLHYSKGTA